MSGSEGNNKLFFPKNLNISPRQFRDELLSSRETNLTSFLSDQSLSKGYRHESRGYVIYSPRALPE